MLKLFNTKFVFMLFILGVFACPKNSYSQQSLKYFYTSNLNNSEVFSKTESVNTLSYSKQSVYSGKAVDLMKKVQDLTGLQFISIPSKNYQEAVSKTSFIGKGVLNAQYTDIFVGAFYDKKNLDSFEYIFTPFTYDNLVVIQNGVEKEYSQEGVLGSFLNKKIFIASGLCFQCLFPEVKFSKGTYYYKGDALSIEEGIDISVIKKSLIKYHQSVVFINQSRAGYLTKDTDLKISKIKTIDNNYFQIPMFVVINKMSPLLKEGRKKLISAIKSAIEEGV